MRHASAAFFIFSLGLAMPVFALPFCAVAAGNALLPSTGTTGTTNSLPSLGLTAATPQTPPATTPQTPPVTQPPPPATSVPTPSLAASVTPPTPPATALAKTPMPTPMPDMKNFITSNVSPQVAATLPSGSIPTHVIHQPDMSNMMAQEQSNLPYSLTINFSNQSMFGANDVAAINKRLGLAPNQITSSCILTVRGIMRTDKSSAMILGTTQAPLQVKYEGMIQNYTLGAVALCLADENRLPPGSGYLTESDGRFTIPLQPVACTPPNRQVSTLTITYNGTATSSCAYN